MYNKKNSKTATVDIKGNIKQRRNVTPLSMNARVAVNRSKLHANRKCTIQLTL